MEIDDHQLLVPGRFKYKSVSQDPARAEADSLDDENEYITAGEDSGNWCGAVMDTCIDALRSSFKLLISFVRRSVAAEHHGDDFPSTEAGAKTGIPGFNTANERDLFSSPRTQHGGFSKQYSAVPSSAPDDQQNGVVTGNAVASGPPPITTSGFSDFTAHVESPTAGEFPSEFNTTVVGSCGFKTSTTSIMHALEDEREAIHTLEQLCTVLERISEYSPVRVEAELDGRGSGDTDSSVHVPLCHICLQVFGPIRLTPHSAVLSLLEDILLEDCVPSSLQISSIHFADVAFSSEAATALQSTTQTDGDADLDVLPAFGFPTTRRGGLDTGDNKELRKECIERFCVFAKNILECYNHTTSVRLTRCSFTPGDLGRGLKLPLLHLRCLYFEKCPLSAAHIDALLRMAKAASRQSSRAQAFQWLEELQLSGSLTEESVSAVLSYFYDELLECEVSLVSLRVPSLWLRVARSHPLLERQPMLVVSSA
ncbi:unnamed protein product [Trypanosoma congolense IL3000]|uniref:WGS project CAEQ00000000 data, annotated contig 2423 n=1 Tax=Trypanosoma congolense (strain IL3000) TaxID=1068625 RepID=F9WE03_TRYCI|nr:unnamed protein product [Trypanosoma congolense IL3000]